MVRSRVSRRELAVLTLSVALLAGTAAAAPGPPTTTVTGSATPTTGVASGDGLASLGIALVLIGATLLYLRRRAADRGR